MTDDNREWTDDDFRHAIPHTVRVRIMRGDIESGGDVAAIRRFVRLSQTQFAKALGISVHTLRNWEQGRRRPDGPGIALLRIAARNPRAIRQNAGISAAGASH